MAGEGNKLNSFGGKVEKVKEVEKVVNGFDLSWDSMFTAFIVRPDPALMARFCEMTEQQGKDQWRNSSVFISMTNNRIGGD